jgi:signal transduction histidine kinase
MNAIMSYVKLARKSGEDYQDNTEGCPHNALDGLQQGLIHTDSISHYFLHLVKEMEKVDRIQSNTLELYSVPTDIRYNLKQVKDIFTTQMQDKNIDFMVYTAELENPYVYCDKNRLQRILLNLISLAYEFTPAGGSIAVTLAQKGFAYHIERTDSQRHFQLYADYELRIKDSGTGMPAEMSNDFVNSSDWEKLFKKIGPERSLAITKHLINLFQGTVNIITEPGQGTEIIISLTLALAKQSAVPIHLEQETANLI